MTDIYSTLDSYGVVYSGEQGYDAPEVDYDVTLGELAAQGGEIAKVRWIGGDYIPGRGKCYDISYVQGRLADGRRVRINLAGLNNWSLVPRRSMKGALIEWAQNERVYAKALGLLDEGRWSVLG